MWEIFQCWSQVNLTPVSRDIKTLFLSNADARFISEFPILCLNVFVLTWFSCSHWKHLLFFILHSSLSLTLLHEIWTCWAFNSIISQNTDFSQQCRYICRVAASGSIETLLSCRDRHGRAKFSQSGGECHVNTLGHTVFMNI